MAGDEEQGLERELLARLWETQDDDPPWSYLHSRPGYTSAWWYPWHDDNVTIGLDRALTRDQVSERRVATCLGRAEDARWAWVVYVIPVEQDGERVYAAFACGADSSAVPALLGFSDSLERAWALVRRAGAMGGESEERPPLAS